MAISFSASIYILYIYIISVSAFECQERYLVKPKTVEASSSFSSATQPSNIIDGKPFTHWTSGNRSDVSEDLYLYFSSVVNVNRITIRLYEASMGRFTITSNSQGKATVIAMNVVEKPINVYKTLSHTFTFDSLSADTVSLSFWKNQDVCCCVTVYEVEIYGCVKNEASTHIPPNLLPPLRPTTLSSLKPLSNIPSKKPTAVPSTKASTDTPTILSISHIAVSNSIPSSLPTFKPTIDLPTQKPWMFPRIKLSVGPFSLGSTEVLLMILLVLFVVGSLLRKCQRKKQNLRLVKDIIFFKL